MPICRNVSSSIRRRRRQVTVPVTSRMKDWMIGGSARWRAFFRVVEQLDMRILDKAANCDEASDSVQIKSIRTFVVVVIRRHNAFRKAPRARPRV